MPKSLVKLEGGVKSFGNVSVLRGVSFEVFAGEVLCIIGPSGAGKSTLLRCLTLLEYFDEGSLSYGDLQVCRQVDGASEYSQKNQIEQARSKFGLVFQNFNLFPHYSVLKNVADPLITTKAFSKKDAEEVARLQLQKLGIEEKSDCVPCDLSGGQQQRVAIARCLALNPSVLYFDEPTSALDPRLSSDVSKLIRTIADRGICVVVVTHDMAFARLVSDRIAIMSQGEFVESGKTSEVVNNPKSEFTYNFLKC